MKVLFFIPSLEYGGAELTIINLANHFSLLGHDVLITTLGQYKRTNSGINKDISVFEMNENSTSLNFFSKILNFFHRLVRLRAHLKKTEPDVAISFLTEANTILLSASIGINANIIISERTHPKYHKISTFYRVLRSLLYRNATNLVVQTDDILRECKRFAKANQISVIPNFIREEFFFSSEKLANRNPKQIIGYVGRLSSEKRLGDLIRSFSIVLIKFPMWKLHLIGDGPEKHYLKDLAKELGIIESIRFKPAQKNVNELFFELSIFVLPSQYEGFSNVLLEAMASQVSVISSIEGGSYLIEDGKDGLMYQTRNVNELAEKISWLIENPIEAKSQIENASIKVLGYSKSKILPLWVNLIEPKI